jgi:hypothetical protein
MATLWAWISGYWETAERVETFIILVLLNIWKKGAKGAIARGAVGIECLSKLLLVGAILPEKSLD